MTAPLGSAIDDWLDQLASIQQDVGQNFEPLTEAQFAWRPGSGKWSVGECLHHLAITGGLMLGKVRPAIGRGRVLGVAGEGPFRYGWLGGWFVRAMETPGKRGMPAPKNFVPPSGVARSAILGQFAETQGHLLAAIQSARGLRLDRLKAPSSAQGSGWIRLNLAAWLASTLAHERRHLAQARRVTKAAGFPGG
jgi:hypothetical protein